MVKNLLRIASLLAVAAMLFSLAACSVTPSPASTSAPAAATSAAAAESSAPAPTVAAAPVTLKYWTAIGATGTSGVHDDAVMKELTKQTGVILNIVFNIDKDQRAAMVASGDLPDAMTTDIQETNGVGVPTMLAANDMINMEPLLADHGADLLQQKGKVQFGKTFLSNGANKLYFIPSESLGLNAVPEKTFDNGVGIGYYIRWDIYKKAGYPTVDNDLFGILPVLKAMQDADSTTADGKKVYAFSPWFADWGLWNFTAYPEGLTNVDAEEAGFVDINPVDNSIKSQIEDTTSTLWQGAKLYYEANKLGLLDPDSLMQKYDQFLDKARTGRLLVAPCGWCVSDADGTFAKNGNPDQGFMPVALPSSITQVCNLFKQPYAARWAMGITTKCKTPEKAMDLLNFINSEAGMSLLCDGIKGVNWNVGSDGLPHLTADTLNLLTKGSNEDQNKAGFNAYTHLYGWSWDATDPQFNCPIRYQFNEDPTALMANATPYEKDFSTHYNVAYPDQLWQKTLPDQNKIYDGSFTQMVDPTPDDISTIDANLLTYLEQALIQIITSKDDTAFQAAQQKIVDDCKGMGADKAFQWHQANYQKAMGKVTSFNDSIK